MRTIRSDFDKPIGITVYDICVDEYFKALDMPFGTNNRCLTRSEKQEYIQWRSRMSQQHDKIWETERI